MVDTEIEPLARRTRWSRSRVRRLMVTLTVTGLVFSAGAASVLWARGVFWAPVRLSQTVGDEFMIAGSAPALPWPAQGQAFLDVEGVGEFGASGDLSAEVPIASITKMMTALQLLADHPIGPSGDGPVITVTQPLFDAAKATETGESGVDLRVGEQLSLRQALEGMLLPSANNMARLLAAWDAGSIAGFVDRMNAQAKALGLAHTNYADPAGIDANSKSTAQDQVKLGEHALENAALTQIVNMRTAQLPVAGQVVNTDHLLGTDGDIGIKTGSTQAAGGCLLFATRTQVAGLPVTLVGAVLGQPGASWAIMDRAQSAAKALIEAAQHAIVATTVVHQGSTVAVLRQRGHADVSLAPGGDVTVLGWPSLDYKVTVDEGHRLKVSSSLQPGAVVTSARLSAGLSAG